MYMCSILITSAFSWLIINQAGAITVNSRSQTSVNWETFQTQFPGQACKGRVGPQQGEWGWGANNMLCYFSVC